MEWVEVKGPSIEVAVAAALEELGLESREEAEVEVIQEPERGFLGVGRREAVVRVKTKPKSKPRRRRRGRGGRNRGGPEGGSGEQAAGAAAKKPAQKARGGTQGQKQRRPAAKPAPTSQNGGTVTSDEPIDIMTDAEKEALVSEFLTGVLGAFDLEGTVDVRTEEDVLFADVVGEQTEALVGPKGAVMQSLHEITRTVVQRKTQERVRLRLDVAGYAARRREALGIYANRLVEQLREEGGGEVMLEPMNPADRKVIHDAVAELEGAESFSEGEEPRRSVVISVPVAD